MEQILYNIDERNILPSEPGVYKFFNSHNDIIYVGKAKSLKKRVASYFNKSANHNLKTKKMIGQIEKIAFTIVSSEYEALLLENNLIKNHLPKFNILMRDDKSYPYLCIVEERFPRLLSVRPHQKIKGKFYGPYTDSKAMNEVLELIKNLYTIRTCNYNLSKANIEKKKFKVCLEYHIKNCLGPCEGLELEEDYNNDIEEVKHILKGNFNLLKLLLKEEMKLASDNLNFEQAHQIKLKIESIQSYYSKSLIINPNQANDLDIISISSTEKIAFISYIKIIKGVISFTQNLEVEKKLDEEEKEILLAALIHLRNKYNSEAEEVISNVNLSKYKLKFNIYTPKIGDKRKLLELCIKNSLSAKKSFIAKKTENIPKKSLITLQEDLNLRYVPNLIECFDNSNIQGTNPVAAMVCFKDGQPYKRNYRKFTIKSVAGANDFASMEEIVGRRYAGLMKEIEEHNNINVDSQPKPELPNLIIIDGGKGQLNAAMKALKKINLQEKIEVISIAKKLEELYKPGDPYPIHLSKSSPSLRLIQRIRDEVHRFAITYHKKKRVSDNLTSSLNNIRGVGPKSIEALLQHFKSVNNIRNSTLEELTKVIKKSKAERVYCYLRSEEHKN